MGVGGKAAYFYEATEQKELISLLNELYKTKTPFAILGSGANSIFADKVFEGVVIRNKLNKIVVQDARLTVESGATIGALNSECQKRGLGGLEMLSKVPGTIGGAVWNNAGAFGMEMCNIVTGGKVWEKGAIKNVTKSFFGFTYRNSILKQNRGIVLLEVYLEMKEIGVDEFNERIQKMTEARQKKDPKGLTCGSFFRNPSGGLAGRLLEEAGAKGLRVGNLEVAKEHANWIMNTGKSSVQDLLKLRDIMKKKVKDRFGVELIEEVDIIRSVK